MANLFTVSASSPLAAVSASHILRAATGEARARAVVFVPTRRAAVSMRAAFTQALAGEASLLPRILPMADMDEALLTLLGEEALAVLENIPPAMTPWQQRFLLAAQVRGFLQQRHGAVSLDYPMALAEDLVALEDQCARAGVTLTPEKLRALVHGDMATHWEQSLEFLNILAAQWPLLEQSMGMTTHARREVLLLSALAEHWRAHPPAFHVFAVGSTASQESAAALLEVIAGLPHGHVMLPAVSTHIPAPEWESIASGHPLFHLKQFLQRFPVVPSQLVELGDDAPSVWAQALGATEQMPHWSDAPLAPYDHIRLVPCAHAESEARVIALLMREALETPNKRTALITPDEGLMARVAAHMKAYGVRVDRLGKGALGDSEAGSLWALLLAALAEPERLLPIRSLLHHPWMQLERGLLAALEPYWYGVRPRRLGQMPLIPEPIRMQGDYARVEMLVRTLARLSRHPLTATQWVEACQQALAPFVDKAQAAQEAMQEVLETLAEADIFGPIAVEEFVALMQAQLEEPLRDAGIAAHPQLVMLTPVEARLERFDRVILGAMTDTVWPSLSAGNAWLNLASQAALGLPPPTHHVSLMAHDMLMLGASAEVFLTWPLRDQGAPATRSRFIERLVTFLAMHGVQEADITASHYATWADARYHAPEFAPAAPPLPRPPQAMRPTRLAVSALDTLFSDPFSVYARYVLGLKKLDEMDADAQASDFGSLAHKAIQALTLHWNALNRGATSQEMAAIAAQALRDFSDRPSTALFWRSRLMRALAFVDGIEQERRGLGVSSVQPEQVVEQEMALPHGRAITLHGRIDRVEHSAQGTVIADYKTGDIPTAKKITEGFATQLLAYAMLATDAQAIEYWRLPHAKHAGEVTRVAFADLVAQDLPSRLRAALAQMLDEQTPFLANPSARGSDYDGISRYDEWAG